MPIHRTRRLRVSISFWKLALGVAFGLWLGFMAIALTGAFAWRHLTGSPLTTSSATMQAPQSDANKEMFEAYKRNLAEIQQKDQENAANVAKCQFWKQQNTTAPSAKSRENVETFCEPRD